MGGEDTASGTSVARTVTSSQDRTAIVQVTIELPLVHGSQLLLVLSPDDVERRSAWWKSLYSRLTALADDTLDWHHDAVQAVFWSRPTMTPEATRALQDVLQQAPAAETENNRTLCLMSDAAAHRPPLAIVLYRQE